MATKGTVYFGYGSNMWKDQMLKRCPTSTYLGIARLPNYRWIINERGYANVVEIVNTAITSSPVQPRRLSESLKHTDEVLGLVYLLQQSDEDHLDINEGVPEAYTKEDLLVDFWRVDSSRPADVDSEPERMNMLVYIDRLRLEPNVPKKEYIYRMNMGIKDALQDGVPVDFVTNVLRKFIPDVNDEDEIVVKQATKQALLFEDET